MNVFVWHVHGAYTTSFVQGGHDYLVPVTPDRGPDGRGRAQTYSWPARVREITRAEARRADVDGVVLQRPEGHPPVSGRHMPALQPPGHGFSLKE